MPSTEREAMRAGIIGTGAMARALGAVDQRAVDEVLEQMDIGSGVFRGKVLIDCTNPVATADNTLDLPVGATSVDDLGCRTVNVGGLDRARYLEAGAAIVIELLAAGEPSGSFLTWVRPLDPADAS